MSKPKLQILVVEDEVAIRRGVCDVLAYHGYVPTGVGDGEAALRAASGGEHALVVLDVMLPGQSGLDVCRQLRRAFPLLPILMLTARGSERDVLDGFGAGADDYVTKPFSVAEMVARVEALLRRAGGLAHAETPFTFGDWEIEPGALKATRSAGAEPAEPVALTAREVAILGLLIRERGRIVSRRMLLAEVWGARNPDAIETRSVDMQIAKLRRKLGLGVDASSCIETVRGAGYRHGGLA